MNHPRSRVRVVTEGQWERVQALLSSNFGRRGHPFRGELPCGGRHHLPLPHRHPLRDLPREEFSPWQTVWKRHRCYTGDGTWDRILALTLAEADTNG